MPNAETFVASNDAYHKSEGLSNSKKESFDDDQIKYYHEEIKKDWPKKPPTPSMVFGNNVHTLVENNLDWVKMCIQRPAMPPRVSPKLKVSKGWKGKGKVHVRLTASESLCGQSFDERDAGTFEEINCAKCRKKLAWQRWEAKHSDLIKFDAGDINPYRTIAENMRAHKRCNFLFEGRGENEINIRWIDSETGLLLRCRIDRVSAVIGAIVDVKTTAKHKRSDFVYEIERRKYFRQLAMYRRGWFELTGERLKGILIPIKNTPGYLVDAIEIDEPWLERGDRENREVLLRYMDVKEKNTWLEPPNDGLIPVVSEPRSAKYAGEYDLQQQEEFDEQLEY